MIKITDLQESANHSYTEVFPWILMDHTPISTIKTNKQTNKISVGKNLVKLKPLCLFGRRVQWIYLLWKMVLQCLKKL